MRRPSRELLQDRNNKVRVLDDENKQILLLNTFDLVPPEVGIFDAPYKCYQVNDQWAKIIMGFVSWLATPSPWEGFLIDDDNEGIQSILQFLSQRGLCMSYELRQNEENPCLLEQSVDGGDTWITAFDYSLCLDTNRTLPPVDLDELLTQLSDLLELYDGTTASIAPNSIPDDSPDDEIRDKVLCSAVYEVIEQIVGIELERRRNPALGLIGAGLITAILAGVVALTGGLATPLALALASILLLGSGLAIATLSQEILLNRALQDAIVCCMASSMSGLEPTKLRFQTSLSGCGFEFGSPEAQFAGAIAEIVSANDDVYVAFLATYEAIWKNRTTYPFFCPCTYESCVFWDTWSPMPTNWTLLEGVASSTALVSSPSGYSVGVYPKFVSPSIMAFKRLNVFARFTEDEDAKHPNTVTAFFYLNDTIVHQEAIVIPTANAQPSSLTFEYEGDVDEIRVFAFGWIGGANVGQAIIVTMQMIVDERVYIPPAEGTC